MNAWRCRRERTRRTSLDVRSVRVIFRLVYFRMGFINASPRQSRKTRGAPSLPWSSPPPPPQPRTTSLRIRPRDDVPTTTITAPETTCTVPKSPWSYFSGIWCACCSRFSAGPDRKYPPRKSYYITCSSVCSWPGVEGFPCSFGAMGVRVGLANYFYLRS